LDSAVAVSERASALDPGRSGFYQNVGVLELARGNRDLAETSFKHALEIDPKSVSACLALAELYRTTARSADAEPWIKRALSIDPENVRANRSLASLYIDGGRIADAEPYLKATAEH